MENNKNIGLKDSVYWEKRREIINGLKIFKLPSHIIGAIPEIEQTFILERLKNSLPHKIPPIIRELKEKYEDR